MEQDAVEFDFSGRSLQDSAIKWLVIPMLVAFVLPYGALLLKGLTGTESYGDFFLWFMTSFRLDQTAFEGQPWRFVTYIFLHGGIVHLLFNMMALLSLYFLAKTHFPRYAWLVIFLLSGVFGGLSEMVLNPTTVGVVGASAGVFGLWGAALVAAFRYSKVDSEERPWGNQRNLEMLTKWLVVNFIIGMAIPGIAKFAHAGGLLLGMIMGYLYPISGQPRLLATRPGLFILVAYKQTPLVITKEKREDRYFTWIKLVPTSEYDPSHDALVAEYDQFDWTGKRTARYQVLSGTAPAKGVIEMFEVATPLRVAGFNDRPEAIPATTPPEMPSET